MHLVDDQHDQRDGQRQEVIHAAIDHQRRQKLARVQVRLQQQHHQALEHPDAARHVAGHPKQNRDEKDAQKRDKRQAAGWQQHVQDGAGQGPVDDDSASCATAMREDGIGSSTLHSRSGVRRRVVITTYATGISIRSQPASVTSRWPAATRAWEAASPRD